MIIHNKKVIIYDIEVFENVFHCVCKDTETKEILKFEISPRKNDIDKLVVYFFDYNNMFCGYNNHHYDDVIINYILDLFGKIRNEDVYIITSSLHNLSNIIINSEDGDTSGYYKWKYRDFFKSMDLLTMMFSNKLRVGLKEMQVTMHYDNVLEYDGDWNKPVPVNRIDEMVSYNINDVESTYNLFNLLNSRGEIDLRLFLEKEYGINALSMDSVKFGETLLANKCSEALGITLKELKEMRSPMDWIPLNEVILPSIKYDHPKLQLVLEDMKKQIVSSLERKSYENKFVIKGVQYSVGVGGVHSINEPRSYIPKEDEYLGHSDVASMYPSFIVQYGWFPRHLGDAGVSVYTDIYHQRIEAKHTGQKLKDKALKLTLNSVTGKMQQPQSWMYDPLSVFKIRINGQLVLLMLVDRLLKFDCKIVQVNTDGVMYIAKKAQKQAIRASIDELETITRLTFEDDEFEAFYQYAVNDYFAVKKGFSETKDPEMIEKKGMFATKTSLGKGLSPTIIPEAVIGKLVFNTPIETTIRSSRDIKKFLMGQRVDKKFSIEYGEKEVQRINRFYASDNGYYLYKVKTENGYKQYTNMLTSSGVTLLNKFDDEAIENRHINYLYYIREARKIVERLQCRQLDLFEQDPIFDLLT